MDRERRIKIVHLSFDAEEINRRLQDETTEEFRMIDSLMKRFLKAKKRYEVSRSSAENYGVLTATETKKCRTFTSLLAFGGRGSAGRWIADVRKPGLTVALESGTDVESRFQEKQDVQEWSSFSYDAIATDERNLFDAFDEVYSQLNELPWWDDFEKNYANRLYTEKYRLAKMYTTSCPVSEGDYLKGVEYFARLDDYGDSADCFDKCNKEIYANQSGIWIKICIGISFVGMLICWVFGYISLGYRIFGIGRFWSGILQSIPAGFLLFGLPTVVVSQLVLLIMFATRKKGLLRKLPYSASEEEWILE